MPFASPLKLLCLLLLGLWAWGSLSSCTGTDTGNPLVNGTDTGNPMLQTAAQGILRDSLGEPLARARVTLRPLSSDRVLKKVCVQSDTSTGLVSFETDSTGAFRASGLRAGPYALVAIAQGQGLLLHFEIKAKDTLVWDSLPRASALRRLAWAIPDSLQGKKIRIEELGLELELAGDSLLLDSLPQGLYSLSGEGTAQILELGAAVLLSSSSAAISSSSGGLSSEILLSSSSGGLTMTDARDGQVYRLVTIGTATWMAENLRYAGVDSSECSLAESVATALKGCTTYGRFYTFAKSHDACPSGTHVASYEDWEKLLLNAGGAANAGTVLKSQTGWAANNGTDLQGLTVLPTGSAQANALGTDAWFWTSTLLMEDSLSSGLAAHLEAASNAVELVGQEPSQGFPVRCVLDKGVESDQ